MTKGRHELALTFKLALLKKENRKTLSSALPLAWILGQYKDGTHFYSYLDQRQTLEKGSAQHRFPITNK